MRNFRKMFQMWSTGVFCLLTTICLNASGTAVADRYYFSHVGTRDGLAFNTVHAIAQDSNGFMWFATEDGLSRYDGNRFKNFHREELGTGSDFITALCPDREGNLWIGSDKGATCYDYLHDRFIPLDGTSDKGTVLNSKVTHICIDDGGIVWMSANGLGLFSYNPKTGQLRNWFCENGRTTLPVNIRSFVTDGNGEFWFSLYFADLWHSDRSLSKMEKVDIAGWIGQDDIMSMDRTNGKLLLASWKNGLCEYDFRRGTLRRLIPHTAGRRPKGMHFDRDGRKIWVATTGGLCMYDLTTGKHSCLLSDGNDKYALAGNNVTSVFVDRSNGLWAGTLSSGLNCAREYPKNFRKYYMVGGESLSGSFIMDMAQDDSGRIWVASENKGLMYVDGKNGELRRSRFALPSNIRSICCDSDRLWVGAWGGVYSLNLRSGEVRVYNRDIRDNAHRLFRTSSGEVLLGYPLGMMIYDRDRDRFVPVPAFDGMYVTGIAESYSGDLWVATYAAGVCRYSPQSGKIEARYGFGGTGNRHIPVDKFMYVYEDSSGGIWVGSYGESFLRYDRDTDSFVRFGDGEGSGHRIAFSMVEDRDGRMWAATEKGIVAFEYPGGSFRYFSEKDGLLDDVVEGHTALLSSDGDIYFASNNGIVSFSPERLCADDAAPQAVLTDFTLGVETVTPGDGTPLKVNVNESPDIVLSHSQNSFGASVSILGGGSPTSGECRYMLEGYDKGWRNLTGGGSFTYPNVPAGDYRLLVESLDGNGRWMQAHLPVRIVVKEVFYKTGAALAAYAVILIMAILGIVRLATKSAVGNERKRQEKEKLIREQEVFREKISFFYNIIHEIKTPLTLIRTPLQNIISTGGLDGELADDLAVIGNNTDYLDKLVRELLDFVRIEENGWVLEYREVDIVGKIDFLCFNFRDTAKNRNVDLYFEHDGADRIVMAADEAALLKILNNLIHNAVKYAETYIRISARVKDGRVELSVRNDGPAIPPERREEIFKPFVQYSNELQPYSQSFGIGLSLARTLARMHGGSLVLSDDADCTDFRLSLPLNLDKIQARNAEKLPGTASNPPEPSTRPLVLVVEDNDDLSLYLSRKLSAEYRVITSPSAERALTLIGENDVDIILTDIALGGMSGIELCRRVTSEFETSHIPVVVLSAISSAKTKIECMESGASLYIEKPFSLDYLTGSLSVIARKRAALKTARMTGQSSGNLQEFDITTGDGEFLANLDRIILENVSDPEFGNDALAERLCLSKSTLIRKVKGLLGTTPNDYIRTKRLNLAAAMLSKGGARINEVCYSVGFNTPSYFTKCFKRQFEALPADYMKEHSQESQTLSKL